MPYTLISYRGHGHETLCFRAREDAERFAEFVHVYMYESDGGSKSGCYWLHEQKIEKTEAVPRKAVTRLDDAELRKMMTAVLVARTCSEPPRLQVDIRHGELDGGIVFRTEPLPPRQRPTVGDLARVFAPQPEASYIERSLGDVRVLEDHGETLTVVPHLDIDDDGTPKRNAKRVTLKTAIVMKIDDWRDRYDI